MKKRIICLGIFGLLAVVTITLFLNFRELSQQKPCAFCTAEIIQNQMFYEDDLILGLCSHKPVCPGHCLIIPKRHVEKFVDLTDQEIVAIMHLLKKIDKAVQKIYGSCSYLVLQKNGAEVGQTVPHVHVHYIPKKITTNKLSVYGLLFNFFLLPFRYPMDRNEVRDIASRFRRAMSID